MVDNNLNRFGARSDAGPNSQYPLKLNVMIKCGFCETGDISYCNHLYGGNNRPVKVLKWQSK